MRALTVDPSKPGSLEVTEVPDPTPRAGELLVRAVAAGICGTDAEIVAGEHGEAPDGRTRLVLGHESLGRVLEAPDGSGFSAGDLVAGVVRRPDPEPCGACANGEFDMCRTEGYTERGIKGLDGFASELWTVEAEYAVAVDPSLGTAGVLMEPTSVVAKAWEQVDRVGGRSWFEPTSVLVTGAGPIGLLAALIGVQRGLDVHVLDHNDSGPKPEAAQALGVTYHAKDVDDVVAALRPDVVIEATGVPELVWGVLSGTGTYGVTCLTGVSGAGRLKVDVGGANRDIVLQNDAIVGSVNANLRHFRAAADVLAAADREWLERLVTTRVGWDDVVDRFDEHGGIKTVLQLER